MEMTSKINRQILEDINLEGIRQLEELVARFHAYEAICTHLYRERLPLQTRWADHADL
jgi:hypothetical protein